jgi:Protein of Unknown function (DUF2604)
MQESKDQGKDNKIWLNVVVSGNPTRLEANINTPLHSLLGKALQESGTVGQPDSGNWVFKDESGTVLDSQKKIEDLGLTEGATIYLSLEAGAAG